MKRVAFYTTVIAATLALLVVLWQFRSVGILLIVSLVLAAALRPSVEFLINHGLPPTPARVLVYLSLVIGVGLGIFLLSGPLMKELQHLSNYLVVTYNVTYQNWSEGTSIQQAIVERLPAGDQFNETMLGAAALQSLFGVTQNVATLIGGAVIIIALSLYWSVDRIHFERLWLSLLPAHRRIQARRIWLKTESTMGAYMRSEIVQSVLAIVLLAVGYTLIGHDYPILTGLLAGIAWIIPLVGFVIAALLSFLLGLASAGGMPMAVAALVVTIVVLAFLEFIVEPRLFRRNQFSGVLIIIVIMMLVNAYGLVGFLIAPPLAVAVQVLLGQIARVIRNGPTTAVQLKTIEKRLQAINERYSPDGDNKSEMPPEIDSLYGRLKELVAEAEEAAREEGVPFA